MSKHTFWIALLTLFSVGVPLEDVERELERRRK